MYKSCVKHVVHGFCVTYMYKVCVFCVKMKSKSKIICAYAVYI